MIKDQMDKKFGSPWHVIVGKAFAYEITYEVRAMHGRLSRKSFSAGAPTTSTSECVCLCAQHLLI